MLDFALEARRGHFHLQVNCALAADWTVVFGPSGSGKTTLLRLLCGLEPPEKGSISLDGRALTDTGARVHVPPGRRGITMVAQQPALFPHLTVAANVTYGLAKFEASARRRKLDEMLRLVDAENLADRYPRDLSGGEAQRVALARALAPMPRLLLLDEPFSALDGAASDGLFSRLQNWTAEHKVQSILVTHDASDAFASAAEVVLLQEGRVVGKGPANDVLHAERERLLGRLKI